MSALIRAPAVRQRFDTSQAHARGTVGHRLARKLDVRSFPFMASGLGVDDDTAALQAAIDFAESLVLDRFVGPGIAIDLGDGTYRLSATLTITSSNIYLVGAAAGSAMLYAPSSNFDLVHFDGSALSLYSVGMLNVKTYTPGNATAGCHIRVRRSINAIFDNLQCIGWFDGIVSDGCAKTYYSNIILSQENRTPGTTFRYALDFASTANNNSDVHVSDYQFVWNPTTQPNPASVRIQGSDGIYFKNGHQFGTTLLIPAGVTCASVMWGNVYFDESVSTNVSFQGNSPSYRNFWFTSCYFRDSKGTGLQFNAGSTISRVGVMNSQFATHRLYGIHCQSSVEDGTLQGCIFDGNNTDNAAGVGDMLIKGEWSIIGNRLTGGGAAGTAIILDAASSDTLVSANSLASSLAGTRISNAGTNNRIRGNTGYAQKSAGQATINNGSTSIVVNHTLAVTPSIAHITLTLNAASAGVTRCWVSGVTATQFTINLDATPTTSATIGWKVDAEQ
jgi:hypothetical protein